MLIGRGQLGDGCVDLRGVARARGRGRATTGPIEVEIFNDGLWARDGAEVLAEIAERFTVHVSESAKKLAAERNHHGR